jgi:hypothetical protein
MRRPRSKSLGSGSRLTTVIALVLGAGTFFTDFELPTLADFRPSTLTDFKFPMLSVSVAEAQYGTSRRVARRTSRRTSRRHAGYGYGGVYGAGYAAPVTTPPASCTTVVSGGGAAQQCTPYMSGSTVVYAP